MKHVIPVLILALGLTACSSDQVTVTLEAAVDAVIAADSIARPEDAPYLALVTSCLSSATSVLASADTPQLKATTIAADCAASVAAGKVGGTTVQAVSAALNAFLMSVETLSAEIQFSRPDLALAFAGNAPHLDRRRLKRIEKKIANLKAAHR